MKPITNQPVVQVSPDAGGVRRLTIDIELGVEPLSGTLYREGESFPFAGWLSLASLLGKAAAAS